MRISPKPFEDISMLLSGFDGLPEKLLCLLTAFFAIQLLLILVEYLIVLIMGLEIFGMHERQIEPRTLRKPRIDESEM